MPISAGTFVVGPNRDYADWKAAADDLAAQLTGDIYLLQLGELTMTQLATFDPDLNGHSLILSCPFPHKGHPESGLLTNCNMTGDVIRLNPTDTAGGGAVDVGHLKLERDGSQTPGGTDALLRSMTSLVAPIKIYIHDLVMNGNDAAGMGIRLTTGALHKVWNIKGRGFGYGGSGALISYTNILLAHADAQRVENCTAYECNSGFEVEPLSGFVGKFNNCVAFDCDADFRINQDQPGDGNISQGNYANRFSGTGNLWDYDGVTNSPNINTEFRDLSYTQAWLQLKDDAEVLPSGGVVPEIDDSTEALRLCLRANNAGAEGNGRPGSDAFYSRGADEYPEVFPQNWTRRARLMIDAGWRSISMDPPLLVRFDAPGLPADFRELVKTYGDDIRITSDPEGQEQVLFEIFRYGSGDTEFTMWAAPDLLEEVPTPLYIWWGNPHASQFPHNNGQTGREGGSRAWSGYEIVLHMGNEFDDLTWCMDSSARQRHPQIDGLTDWGTDGDPVGVRASMSSAKFNIYQLDELLNDRSAVQLTAMARSSTSPGVDTIMEVKRVGVQRLLWNLDERLNHLAVRAPDSQSAEEVTGDANMGTSDHVVGAYARFNTDRMVAWLDGEIDDEETVAFANNETDNTDGDVFTVAKQADNASPFRGSLREVRLRYFNTYDDWTKLVHQSLAAGATLFVGPYSGGACMNGVRNFTFNVPGSGPFTLANTDFWLSYHNDGAGGLTLQLNGIWDKVCPVGDIGLARRVKLEQLVRELNEWFVDLKGTLTVDKGLDSEIELSAVKLLNADWEEISNNAGLIYTLEFGLTVGIASGAQAARLLVFGGKALSADNFIVNHAGRDQSQFKTVFRAAPVRIPGGPPIKSIVVSAIVEGLQPGSLVQRRQQAEAVLKDWIDNYLGQQALLTIDGQGLGMAHLAAVQAGALDLPEAVGYDLEFAIAYGS